jgi:hypothetical protein
LGGTINLNSKRLKCPNPGQPLGPHANPWKWPGRAVGSTYAVLACAVAVNLSAGIAAPPVIGSFGVWNVQEVANLVGANLVGSNLVVANMTGRSLEFEPQNSDGSSRLSGCLQKKTGRFLLKDENTHVTVELTGPHLDKEANHRIEAVGSLDPAAVPLSEASEVIRVTSVKRIGKACAGVTAADRVGMGGWGYGRDGHGPGQPQCLRSAGDLVPASPKAHADRFATYNPRLEAL